MVFLVLAGGGAWAAGALEAVSFRASLNLSLDALLRLAVMVIGVLLTASLILLVLTFLKPKSHRGRTLVTPPPVTEPLETLPEPSAYPLADGTLDITVYNGSPDMAQNGENKLLYQTVIPEAEFTGLSLPPYEPQEGFQFLGFVLRADTGSRLLSENMSPEDTSLVPPGEDGVRRIVIEGTWRVPDSEDPWMPLTLDPGNGMSPMHFDATGPLYSASIAYLSAFPVPERPGFLFAGWYRDEAGTDGPV